MESKEYICIIEEKQNFCDIRVVVLCIFKYVQHLKLKIAECFCVMMNPSTSFEPTNPPASASAIPFDFNLHSTIYNHISNLSDHLHTLSQIHSRIHPLSADQAPLHENVASDLLTISASLQGYHTTLTQLVQPINSEPMVLGAERFIARVKEHTAFLSRLETRKRAIRRVKEDIEKIQVKKGGPRKDLRFTHGPIEALVKELGLSHILSD